MNRPFDSNLPGRILTGMLFFVLIGGWVVANAEQEGDTVGNVSRGAISWSQNCARCHEMRNPTEYRDDLWKPIVTHMRVRAGLTGQQQQDVLAFLQAANNPSPLYVSGSGTGMAVSGAAPSGKQVYDTSCIACHGQEGTGALPGAPDFTAVNGPLSQSDDILLRRITQGFQTPGSPMAMPAMGGNPNLTAADARAVLDYLRETFGPR